jgi:hypothetical protein
VHRLAIDKDGQIFSSTTPLEGLDLGGARRLPEIAVLWAKRSNMFHVNIVVLAARYRYRPERRGRIEGPVVDAGSYRRKLGNGGMSRWLTAEYTNGPGETSRRWKCKGRFGVSWVVGGRGCSTEVDEADEHKRGRKESVMTNRKALEDQGD